MNIPTNGPNVCVDDLRKHLDHFLGPESTGDQLDAQDSSAWDEQTSPVTSPIDRFRQEEAGQSQCRPSAGTIIRPSPKVTLEVPRPKKKSVVNRMWGRLRKLFAKKFEKGNQATPNLSEKLAPDRDDEPQRHDALFSKPPKSTTKRR